MARIAIVPPDPRWPAAFRALAGPLQTALGVPNAERGTRNAEK
jgi:GrpB-like predicted nucleotidyltransferase (UPF0157 family)